MSDAIAYRLKQIMTNDHLNLAQAAKQIGISPTSMRKVMNNKELSQPVMMKINRFIDEHPISAGERRSFTIFPSDESAQENDKKQQAARRNQAQASQASDKRSAPQSTSAKSSKEAATRQPAAQKVQGKQSQAKDKATKQTAKTKSTSEAVQKAKRKPQSSGQKSGKTQSEASAAASATADAKDTQQSHNNRNNRRKNNSSAARASVKPKAQSVTNKSGAEEKPSSGNIAKAGNNKQTHDDTRKQANHHSTAKKPSQSASEGTSDADTKVATSSSETSSYGNVPTTNAASVPAMSAKASVPATEPEEKNHESAVHAIQIFLDESFVSSQDYQRAMSIGATVVPDDDDSSALDRFIDTLYPFGWMPGDEVKARGKSQESIAKVLERSRSDAAPAYAVYSPLSDAGNFSLGFGVLYPYVAAILRILAQLPTLPTKVRIALDKRNEITDDKLGMGARMLHAYVKAQTGQDVIFLMRTADSRENPGLQYADFISHAALHFDKETMKTTGIRRLADVGGDEHDNLTLFAMVGLQKYLIDDQISGNTPRTFKNDYLSLVARAFNLISQATTLADVSDDTLAMAKTILNQLLQLAPASVTGALNNMPFKSWYDLAARAAVILHFSDDTLPSFELNRDALEGISAQLNALANVLTLG